jgi:hypothetical protein
MILPHPRLNLIQSAFVVLVVWGFAGGMLSGCQREVWDSNPNHALRFSTDTLFFDTVFATVGSVTLPLKIYNDHDGTLLIDEIELEDGLVSQYRLNVNGAPVTNLAQPVRDLALAAGDSMYLFVEVTVDPNAQAGASPFWVIENLRFLTNGNEQVVKLMARGQNAVFHGGPDAYTTLACDEIWTSDLPHVIYGRILVDPGCTLTLMPGTTVHGHDGSGIWVRGGTLLAEGELGNPVVFKGDRLDDDYQDAAGQWGLAFELTDTLSGSLVNYSAFRGGIWLDRAVNCEMDFVELSQATVGLWVDSVGAGADYALRLRNSVVTQAESIGILSQGGHILGYNNLISNCGQACGYFALGGNIQLHLTTFANYGITGNGLRQFPTLYLNDWYEAFDGSLQLRPFEAQTEFRNCIAFGNNAGLNDFSEVIVDLWAPEGYASPLITASAIHFQGEDVPSNIFDNNTAVNQAPPFSDASEGDFTLTGNAAVWNGASSIPPFTAFEVSKDLVGESRNTVSPTKGCFERIP